MTPPGRRALRRPSPRAAPLAPRAPAPAPRPRIEDDELEALAALGYAEFVAERLDRARIVFEGLASLAPRHAYVQRALAETCLALGDHPAALRAANAAITLAPRSAPAYGLRGRILLAADRPADARADLVRAHRLGDALAGDLLTTF